MTSVYSSFSILKFGFFTSVVQLVSYVYYTPHTAEALVPLIHEPNIVITSGSAAPGA